MSDDRSLSAEDALKLYKRQLDGKETALPHPRYDRAINPEEALKAYHRQIGKEVNT